MITINLFDHKRIVTEVRVQKNITASLAIMLVGAILVGAFWALQQVQVSQQKIDTDRMNKLAVGKEPHYNKVVAMKTEKAGVQAIINKIDTLRNPRYETPQLMEDLSESIPEGVWLTSIQQKDLDQLRGAGVPVLFIQDDSEGAKKKKRGRKAKKEENKGESQHLFIELRGMAKVDQAIVRYMEQLEKVSYLDHIFLQTTQQRWIGLEEVRTFTIYCHIANPPPTIKKA